MHTHTMAGGITKSCLGRPRVDVSTLQDQANATRRAAPPEAWPTAAGTCCNVVQTLSSTRPAPETVEVTHRLRAHRSSNSPMRPPCKPRPAKNQGPKGRWLGGDPPAPMYTPFSPVLTAQPRGQAQPAAALTRRSAGVARQQARHAGACALAAQAGGAAADLAVLTVGWVAAH